LVSVLLSLAMSNTSHTTYPGKVTFFSPGDS
jgi:hypothetical protein